MKICSIGNSFSQDAHKWLHKLAKANGVEFETANLFIGGCCLGTHWKNADENNALYDLELNGGSGKRKISIAEALELEKWDIITVQQVSSLRGMYETDSGHSGFVNYNNDQAEMYSRIKQTSEIAAQSIHAELIPTGEVIQTLRETVSEFDYQNGGLSLCRDGFHLSLDYGRFAVAATQLRTITSNKIKIADFEDFNPELLNKS